MRAYERNSLIIAAGLSIAVHATAVVYFTQSGSQQSRAQIPPDSTLQISMMPAQQQQQQPQPQPRPVRAAPVADPAPPLVTPGPVPELQTVPASTRISRPVPAPAPAAADKQQALPPVETPALAAAVPDTIVQHALPGVPENAQETYLQRLLAHIDSHKFYPRSARRRGLEGEVRVTFTLLEDGSIRSLQVNGGSRVLRKAAERAVLSAQPMPAPPAGIRFQDDISFGMVFRLG